MIAYFFHFCQSDFGDLWGHGEVGWLAAKKSAGRQRISATSPHLRCLLGFLPALKATDFAGVPFLRCLFALLRGEKATNFSAFPHLRCLLGFLPALKATDFAGFPFFRCLFALLRGGEAADFSAFPHLRCLSAHAPKNEIFRQTHCNPAPGMVQYRVSSYVSRHACMAGEHRLRPAQT